MEQPPEFEELGKENWVWVIQHGFYEMNGAKWMYLEHKDEQENAFLGLYPLILQIMHLLPEGQYRNCNLFGTCQ